MKAKGLLAVEMEAEALYAFAAERLKPVLCFAHVSNQMALAEGEFEKGGERPDDKAEYDEKKRLIS